jgi:dephospho-CoA kinase
MRIHIITGGLGAGKSTATRFFVERGAVVHSLDEIAHDVLTAGSQVLERVAEEFGPGVLAQDGSLDRAALAELAFACHDTAERLNAIVHPEVVAETRRRLARSTEGERPPSAIILEVPLLAEAPELCDLADEILAINAPEEVRVERAVARGMDRADALHRIACQADDEERAALATKVIDNDADEESFLAAMERYADELLGVPAPAPEALDR